MLLWRKATVLVLQKPAERSSTDNGDNSARHVQSLRSLTKVRQTCANEGNATELARRMPGWRAALDRPRSQW